MFEKSLKKLNVLASKLPQDQCIPSVGPTPDPGNSTGIFNITDGLDGVGQITHKFECGV